MGWDDFSNEPISISEFKADRAHDARLMTVRDMLVQALRDIDSGRFSRGEVDAAILILHTTEPATEWALAGPKIDKIYAMGLLARAESMLNEA